MSQVETDYQPLVEVRLVTADINTPALEKFVSICCGVTFVWASLVLSSWIVGNQFLIRFLPSLPGMTVSTAVCFVFASASLFILSRQETTPRQASLGRLLSSLIILIGAFYVVTSFLPGWSTYSLLRYGDRVHLIVTRMSANTAVNVVLLGFSIYLLDTRWGRDRWPSQILAVFVTLESLIVLASQLFGVTPLLGLSKIFSISIPTTILFLVTSGGVLVSRPSRGLLPIVLSRTDAGVAARRLLLAVLSMPIVMGLIIFTALRFQDTSYSFLPYLASIAAISALATLVWTNMVSLNNQIVRTRNDERQFAARERKQMQNLLSDTQERLQMAIEGAGIGTWHWDIRNNLFVGFGRTTEMMGLDTSDPVPFTRFFRQVHHDDQVLLKQAMNEALEQQKDLFLEYRVIGLDGNVRWISIKGRAYQDPQGLVVRYEGIFQDVDARVKGEEQLKLAADLQRHMLRDVLLSVTDGKLALCFSPLDLPPREVSSASRVDLAHTSGLRALRVAARDVAERAGHSQERTFDLVTAVSEAAMNAQVHGRFGVAFVACSAAGTVQVRVEDTGGGIRIDQLTQATLQRGFSTKASLGQGLKLILETVDRVYLLTGLTGTTIVMEQDVHSPEPAWLKI